jgi:hypothetical protein
MAMFLEKVEKDMLECKSEEEQLPKEKPNTMPKNNVSCNARCNAACGVFIVCELSQIPKNFFPNIGELR